MPNIVKRLTHGAKRILWFFFFGQKNNYFWGLGRSRKNVQIGSPLTQCSFPATATRIRPGPYFCGTVYTFDRISIFILALFSPFGRETALSHCGSFVFRLCPCVFITPPPFTQTWSRSPFLDLLAYFVCGSPKLLPREQCPIRFGPPECSILVREGARLGR